MYTPDFLITPYCVKSHEGLRPSDGDVYSVIYWYERLKDGKCTASNESIARVACCGVRNVRGSLDRLEKHGFIVRYYHDPETRVHRKQIKTTVYYQAPGAKPQSVQSEPKEGTPGEIARRFFDPEDETERIKTLDFLVEKTGAPREAVENEMRKFVAHWTEPNKSGTKVRWQMQQTFDVKRRLYTWLSRAREFNKNNYKSGAGVTI